MQSYLNLRLRIMQGVPTKTDAFEIQSSPTALQQLERSCPEFFMGYRAHQLREFY